MKKKDLRTGMLIQTAGHKLGMIINNYVVYDVCVMSLDRLNIFLEDVEYPENTINKVSSILDSTDLMPSNWTLRRLNHLLLWERKEEPTFCTLDGVDYSESTLRSLIKKATK